MGFHRLTVPSYFGGLPGGYDYVNNALVGTPANADSAKVGGPNAGTYFVAFGEDGLSANANRANKALAQNTDFIDDLLHQDLAVPTRTVNVTPGGPVTSITIVGPGIFLGNLTDELQDLFHITDASDNDIEITGTKVTASSIAAGGALGSGFSAGNVTINLTATIPTGQTYRVWYGTRSNLATLPSDALVSMRVRSAVQVEAATEELFRLLHGNGEAWNAAWDADIYTLNQNTLELRTILANLHGNGEAYNAVWDTTINDTALHFRGLPVLNWQPGVTTGTPNLKRMHFQALDQIWFAVGDGGADFLASSIDFGQSWTYLNGSLGSSLFLLDAASSPSGTVVLLSTGQSVYRGTRTSYNTYAFAVQTNVMSHFGISSGMVAWDDTNGKFIAVYRSGAAGEIVDTSPTGAVWTQQTTPATWSGYTGTHGNPVLKVIPGRAIAAFVDEGASKINVMRSTDGGTTWTNVQIPVPGGFAAASTQALQITYDVSTTTWYMLVSDSVTIVSIVYKSTDGGATWLPLTPNVLFNLYGLEALPGCLVAVLQKNRIIMTTNYIQWFHVANNAQTNDTFLYLSEGGGGLMVMNSADKKSWSSRRLANNANEWEQIF